MKHFSVESEGHVQTWTMSNPPMNYMTAAMSQELTELIGRTEADENVRAIILTGGIEGKFITHYSVDELAEGAADPAECARTFPLLEAGFHRMLDRIMLMPKVVIAQSTETAWAVDTNSRSRAIFALPPTVLIRSDCPKRCSEFCLAAEARSGCRG